MVYLEIVAMLVSVLETWAVSHTIISFLVPVTLLTITHPSVKLAPWDEI